MVANGRPGEAEIARGWWDKIVQGATISLVPLLITGGVIAYNQHQNLIFEVARLRLDLAAVAISEDLAHKTFVTHGEEAITVSDEKRELDQAISEFRTTQRLLKQTRYEILDRP